MDYNEFIKKVKERAEIPTENEAVRAIAATLTTLAQRMAGGQPGNMAAQLPEGVKEFLNGVVGKGNDFPVDEFFHRVAEREGVELAEGSKHARAVMVTIGEAISGGEAMHIMHQLPTEYAQLFYVGGGGYYNQETTQPQGGV